VVRQACPTKPNGHRLIYAPRLSGRQTLSSGEATSSHTCLPGGSLSIASSSSGSSPAEVSAGQVQLNGFGMKNSAGQALTLVDGRIGAGAGHHRHGCERGEFVNCLWVFHS
jgi:hypothetical protein